MSATRQESIAARGEQHRRLDALLRHCVECGLCLPHCATYLATGDETDSPRGRLILLQAVFEGIGSSSELFTEPTRNRVEIAGALAAFDRCIGCHACESACPSGVPFELLAHAQLLATEAGQQAKAPGAALLDRRPLLELLRRMVPLVRRLAKALAGSRWRRRLDTAPAGVGPLVRLMGTLPTAPQRDQALFDLLDARVEAASQSEANSLATKAPAQQGDTGRFATNLLPPRVAFFGGCANASLLPGSSRRLQELLVAAGCRVTVPTDQRCCGAVAAHTGRPDRAADLRELNVQTLIPALRDADVLVVEAAGCGLRLSEYPPPVAEALRDAVVLLAGLKLPHLAPLPLTVAIHDPCHGRHGLGIVAEPRTLLGRIPQLILVEPEEADVCCGSGGTYSLRHRSLSAAMGRRKAEVLAQTGADLVVTSNPGCLGQIADGLELIAPDLPIIPLTDLVWYAWRRARTIDHAKT